MCGIYFGFHRFRLHNKHNKVVNPTSGRGNWTICHRNERDGPNDTCYSSMELLETNFIF